MSWKEYLFGNNWANIAWFFMGGICGTSFFSLRFFCLDIVTAGIWTLGIILVKEFLDTVTRKIPFLKGKFGFDPSGGDWKDVMLGIVGIVVTLVILTI